MKYTAVAFAWLLLAGCAAIHAEPTECHAGYSRLHAAAEAWPEAPLTDIMQIAQSGPETPIILQGTLTDFVDDDLNTPWAHDYSPRRHDIPCQILKLPTDATVWKDPESDVVFGGNWSGAYTVSDVEALAAKHPRLWWALGEEDNFWPGVRECPWEFKRFDGLICDRYPSPEVYGRWLYGFVGAIKRGHQLAGAKQTGGLVPFYFVQDRLPAFWGNTNDVTPTGVFLARAAAEWERHGWGNIPADAVVYNYRPYADPEARDKATADGIAWTVNYWRTKWQEMQDFAWLTDAALWGETDQGRTYRTGSEFTVPATTSQWCDQARRVVELIDYAEGAPWVGALLLYGTITDADTQAPLQVASMYVPGGYGGDVWPYPQAGDLSIVGRALRDRRLPAECE